MFDKLMAITNETERVKTLYDYFNEDERLTESRAATVEFLTTVRALDRALPPSSRVLDLGAGTGAYSLYLADKGHRVTAVDLSEKHVDHIKKKAGVHPRLTAMVGNALDLSAFSDASFDAVLLLGPLYHLEKKADRLSVLAQVKRVLTAEGILFSAIINHDMIPFSESARDPNWPLVDSYDVKTLRIPNFPFVFQTLDEAEAELVASGFAVRRRIAPDGLAETMATAINRMTDAAFERFLRFHLKMSEEPAFIAASNHLLFESDKAVAADSPDPDPAGTARDIADYLTWPFTFTGFLATDDLVDGDLRLKLTRTSDAVPEKKWVPAYAFDIMLKDEKAGFCNLRIGFTEGLFFSGNIGYTVFPAFQGQGLAVRACRLLGKLAQRHGMTSLIISNAPSNFASRRVCDKLGARQLRVAAVPDDHPLKAEGQNHERIFRWDLG